MPRLLLVLLHTLSPEVLLILMISTATHMSRNPNLHLLLWIVLWALDPNRKLFAPWSPKGSSNWTYLKENWSRSSLLNFFKVVLLLMFVVSSHITTFHYFFYHIKLVIKPWHSSLKSQMHSSSPSSQLWLGFRPHCISPPVPPYNFLAPVWEPSINLTQQSHYPPSHPRHPPPE